MVLESSYQLFLFGFLYLFWICCMGSFHNLGLVFETLFYYNLIRYILEVFFLDN
jgi:hypothetical protein